MKLRELLISTAMMSLTFVPAEAVTPPLPSPLLTEDKILGEAYYDTLNILNTPNQCSEFFGGASASVDIFNELIANVRKEYFPSWIGIKMSGVVNVSSMTSKRKYRLFEKVSINANGPFYRRRYLNAETNVPGIGRFAANTKEARVLMLLHELGHMVQGKSGDWLLPDDGNDEAQSRENTRKIEGVCVGQLKNLGKGDTTMNSAIGKQQQDKKVTQADATVTTP